MEYVSEGPTITDGERAVADLSNVICLLEEEDIKPDISNLSHKDHHPVVKEENQDELFPHNTYYKDIKTEFSDDELTIKQEKIDYENKIEPDSEMKLMQLGKVNKRDSINLGKCEAPTNEEFGYVNCLEKDVAHHKSEKPFKCCYCDKAYPRLSHLNRHQRVHTGEKPFKCNFCDKAFSDPSHLKTHQRSHTGEKPFKCSYCDKAFSSSFILIRHQRIHTGEKPFKCNYCDKAFSQSYDLNNHLRVHTGEKPFKCDYCNKAFFRSSHLNRHQRIHLKCNRSDEAFPNLDNHHSSCENMLIKS